MCACASDTSLYIYMLVYTLPLALLLLSGGLSLDFSPFPSGQLQLRPLQVSSVPCSPRSQTPYGPAEHEVFQRSICQQDIR